LHGLARCAGAAVTIATELHSSHPAITDVEQRLQHPAQVEVPTTEGQVFVHAVRDVVQVHVHEHILVRANHVRFGAIARDEQVADIQAKPEIFAADAQPASQFDKSARALDEHPRLGLEREPDTAHGGMLHQHPHPIDEPLPQDLAARGAGHVVWVVGVGGVGGDTIGRSSGPNGHQGRSEFRGHFDGPFEQVEPFRPVLALVFKQRGEMLAPWIEQVASTRFQREREAAALRFAPHANDVRGRGAQRIELPDVRRDRDPFVAQVGKQRERILEPMVREAVGVVGEAKHDESQP